VIDFTFEIGRFVDPITKVDVHIGPRERGADPLKLCFRPYKPILLRWRKKQMENGKK